MRPGAGYPQQVSEVSYTHTDGFADALRRLGSSLLVSTYQAGQLLSVGVHDGHVTFDARRFDQPMGVAVRPDRIAVGTRGQVWTLVDHPELAPRVEPAGRYDRCMLARTSIVTGGIHGHEIAWGLDEMGAPELWVVNTLFSCLAVLDGEHSFVARWRPPFVSRLAPEDRCHLNGLAMRDGEPTYVTALARTDTPRGWRYTRQDGGVVLQVPSGEIVASGLSMPHSPRWHEDQLFVLNSGLGRLEKVDTASGAREIVAMVPGYARGLAISRGLAFVGLSRIREKHVFGGTLLSAFHEQLKCGVGVVDVRTGGTVAVLEFTAGVEEIFDVQLVPNSRCLTLGSAAGDGREIWLVSGGESQS